MADTIEFAVVDVETTGFSPAKNDRVIEIAVVRVDETGRTIDEYVTLVNPHRDAGPTHLHGITARELQGAPSFDEIAGDVLERMSGAVFVAHNARFDMAFVKHEMQRAGVQLPQFPYTCTMQLAGLANPDIPSRKLGEVCDYFGISVPRTHSAIGDAKATGALLTMCLKKIRTSMLISGDGWQSMAICGPLIGRPAWPKYPPSGKAFRRDEAAIRIASEPCYIARLVSMLPTLQDSTPQIDAYLEVLDRILEDRRVSEEEADALASVADELGIIREQAVAAHERYLSDLVCVALEDGVLSDSERKDLNQVQRLLDVPDPRYASMIAKFQTSPASAKPTTNSGVWSPETTRGKSVCFTGQLCSKIDGELITREQAEGIANSAGMDVRASVTKGLDLLVTADPDSMSGKAEKARKYGVRILSEPVFWKMVGVNTD